LGLRVPTPRWLRCADSAGRQPSALQAATNATICADDASVALVVRAAYAAADALVLRAGCHQALRPPPAAQAPPRCARAAPAVVETACRAVPCRAVPCRRLLALRDASLVQRSLAH
jgi:hypothetical protein